MLSAARATIPGGTVPESLDTGTVPPEVETDRLEAVAHAKSAGMTLRSQSRESRAKVVVSAEIHTERSGFASRPEPEVARPEVEIAPVANPSWVVSLQ